MEADCLPVAWGSGAFLDSVEEHFVSDDTGQAIKIQGYRGASAEVISRLFLLFRAPDLKGDLYIYMRWDRWAEARELH